MRLPEKVAHCCAPDRSFQGEMGHCCAPDRSFQEEMGVVVDDAAACGLAVEASKMGGFYV
jgi:hypothetical protein